MSITSSILKDWKLYSSKLFLKSDLFIWENTLKIT